MKLKYYLRGLGLGIIFTSIILAVAYSQNKGLMTDSEVKKRASELGMVSTESESSDLFNQNDTEIQGTDEQGGELVDQPQDSEQSQAGDSQDGALRCEAGSERKRIHAEEFNQKEKKT